MSAIIFPGQGSQFIGMAIDFSDNYLISRNIFEEIEDYSKIKIRKIISENIEDKLNQTKYTQIAIFSASMVIYKTLIDQFGIEKISTDLVLGHSLGEYSALVANQCLSLKDASNLIKIRGDLMNSAIQPNKSGMAAVIGKNANFVNEIIKSNNLNVNIANDNSPLQVVISGLTKELDEAKDIFISAGVKKYVKLNVSAAFHSKYMLDAQNKLNNQIDKVSFTFSNIPIISNFNAEINSDTSKIIECLKNQMANKVKWTDSVKKLDETNISEIIEIGPGKVLSGLISRISNKFSFKSVNKINDMEKFI